MSHTFLASVNRHYHIRCNVHLETLLVISTDRVQKFWQVTEAVTPVLVVGCRFHKCLFNVVRCVKIRGSHAHVVYFISLFLKLKPPLIQRSENFISK